MNKKPKPTNNKELLDLLAEAESDKIADLKDTNTRLLKQIDNISNPWLRYKIL